MAPSVILRNCSSARMITAPAEVASLPVRITESTARGIFSLR
jgi:hypothetical protein